MVSSICRVVSSTIMTPNSLVTLLAAAMEMEASMTALSSIVHRMIPGERSILMFQSTGTLWGLTTAYWVFVHPVTTPMATRVVQMRKIWLRQVGLVFTRFVRVVFNIVGQLCELKRKLSRTSCRIPLENRAEVGRVLHNGTQKAASSEAAFLAIALCSLSNPLCIICILRCLVPRTGVEPACSCKR